jgi:hypothetical protein
MGVYSVPVTMRAINDDFGILVEDTIDARVTIRGVGPKLVITSVLPKTVNPGSSFTLTLTIENRGDDTARQVFLWSAAEGAESVLIIGGGDDTEMNGDLAAPIATMAPIVIQDIAPGENVTVNIAMKSNADMSGGHVFEERFGISYVDSFGVGPSSAETYHTVAIKSSGIGVSSRGMLYLVLTLVGIVVFAAVIVVAFVWARKNWVPRRKKNASPYIVGSEQPPQPPQ